MFRWKVNVARNVRAGQLAGTRGGEKKRTSYTYLKIDGFEVTAQRVAWLYVYGEWPKKLLFRNKDYTDFRIVNLVEANTLPKKYDHSTPEGRAAYLKAHRDKYFEAWRAGALLKNFGITTEEYESMHLAQGGKCAICGGDENTLRNGKRLMLAVDHHHGSGRFVPCFAVRATS